LKKYYYLFFLDLLNGQAPLGEGMNGLLATNLSERNGGEPLALPVDPRRGGARSMGFVSGLLAGVFLGSVDGRC
jgi:hypothetical protein